MADLLKTIDDQQEDHWSESSEEEDFEMENNKVKQNNDFFSGITGNYQKQRQTESNSKINEKATEKILKQTDVESSLVLTNTNDKIQRLQNKKRRHKLSIENDQEDEDFEEKDEELQKQLLNQDGEEKVQKKEKLMEWQDLKLGKPIIKAIDDLDYLNPTKIQELCIPAAVMGKDILASSLTGSGKTGAFLIPLLQRFYRSESANYCKALIVLPTRELAFQCYEMFQNLNKYTKLRACLVIGAADMRKQETELRRHPEFIIATPGRLIDHLQNSQSIDLDNLEVLVLDEADKLVDLGFTAEVTQIAEESNDERQTLLFSATMNKDVEKVIALAMKKPIRLHANPDSATSDKLKQYVLKLVAGQNREASLVSLVMRFYKDQTLIFFKTKRECHRMAIIFGLMGLKVCELHGNLSQSQRIQAFEDFKTQKYDFLMATDLAARGLDIKELKAVINYELPQEVTRYIHRVGRTARAGKKGVSVTICHEKEILKLKKLMKGDRSKLEKVYLEEKQVKNVMQKIQDFEKDIERIMRQEQAEKNLRKAEIEATRAMNLIEHADEIYNKPKKTWFQSKRDKNTDKRVAKEALGNDQFYLDEEQSYSQSQKKEYLKAKQTEQEKEQKNNKFNNKKGGKSNNSSGGNSKFNNNKKNPYKKVKK